MRAADRRENDWCIMTTNSIGLVPDKLGSDFMKPHFGYEAHIRHRQYITLIGSAINTTLFTSPNSMVEQIYSQKSLIIVKVKTERVNSTPKD